MIQILFALISLISTTTLAAKPQKVLLNTIELGALEKPKQASYFDELKKMGHKNPEPLTKCLTNHSIETCKISYLVYGRSVIAQCSSSGCLREVALTSKFQKEFSTKE